MRFPVSKTRAREAILIAAMVASLLHPRTSASEKTASPAELARTLNTDRDDQKRLDALRELEKTSPLDSKQIMRSLADTSAAIRTEIIRLALPLIPDERELQIRLLALSNDRSESVRLQLLKSIPHFNHPSTQKSLLRILTLQIASTEGAYAAGSTLEGLEWETLKALLSNPEFCAKTETNAKILNLLTSPIAKLPESLVAALDFIAVEAGVPARLRAAILQGIRPQESDAKLPLHRKPESLALLTSSTDATIREAARRLESHLVWPEFPAAAE